MKLICVILLACSIAGLQSTLSNPHALSNSAARQTEDSEEERTFPADTKNDAEANEASCNPERYTVFDVQFSFSDYFSTT